MKVEITENILVKTSGHILSRKLIKSLINAIKHKKKDVKVGPPICTFAKIGY